MQRTKLAVSLTAGVIIGLLTQVANGACFPNPSVYGRDFGYVQGFANNLSVGACFSSSTESAEGSWSGSSSTFDSTVSYAVSGFASVRQDTPNFDLGVAASARQTSGTGSSASAIARAVVNSQISVISGLTPPPSFVDLNMHLDGQFTLLRTSIDEPASVAFLSIKKGSTSASIVALSDPTFIPGAVGFDSFSIQQSNVGPNVRYDIEGDMLIRLGLQSNLLGTGLVRNFRIQLQADAITAGPGQNVVIDFEHTFSLTSITLPDGRTIEEAGVSVSFEPVSVPEPSTFTLAAFGLLGLLGAARRRRGPARASLGIRDLLTRAGPSYRELVR